MIKSVDISCIIIAKNEEENIHDCLISILQTGAADMIGEVILVDSNSCDSTVDIASEFDISIYKITNNSDCTPSAGRYIGTQYARYEDLLFVDGDMIINPDWLKNAYNYLKNNPDIGGVSGYLNNSPNMSNDTQKVKHFGGLALYRKEALDDAGGFNPNLSAFEDIDIGYRMNTAGWHLVKLPILSAKHPNRISIDTIKRKWNAGYYFGSGQTLREAISEPKLFMMHIRRVCISAFLTFWLSLGFILLYKNIRILPYIGLSLSITVALFYKIGPKKTLVILLKQPFLLIGTTIGFIRYSPEFNIESVEQIQ